MHAPSDAPLAARRGELTALDWAYRSPRFEALGHAFSIRTTDPALGAHLDRVFAALRVPGPPAAFYSFVDRGPCVDRRYAVYWDDERIVLATRPARALRWMLWHVNQEAVERSRHLVLLHAAGAEWRGRGVVLPAPMESGKTTLVAGLVASGLRYLTDEAVAIDPATLLVKPFPKALSVDAGAWQVLADLEPDLDPRLRDHVDGQWQVAPDDIRRGAVAPSVRPSFVIAPHYEQGGRTSLEPVSRAEAAKILVENSFNFHDDGRRNLATLAAVLAGCRCYRLRVGDLHAACDLVLDLLCSTTTTGER